MPFRIKGKGGDAKLGEKTITANGTYSALADELDGYSKVIVNVPVDTGYIIDEFYTDYIGE